MNRPQLELRPEDELSRTVSSSVGCHLILEEVRTEFEGISAQFTVISWRISSSARFQSGHHTSRVLIPIVTSFHSPRFEEIWTRCQIGVRKCVRV
jgi:hypothetical protein